MAQTLIFTADIHLRDSSPKCRTDDFQAAQWDKLAQVVELCRKYDAIWLDAGDLLHKAYPSLALIAKTLKVLGNRKIYTLFGNHDMPFHNRSKVWEAGLGVLFEAGAVGVLGQFPKEIGFGGRKHFDVYGWPYGEEFKEKPYSDGINILVHHGMIFKGRQDAIPGAEGCTAKKFMQQHKDFDLIVCGHNHQAFEVEVGNRVLVNVGCLTRQSADFADHKPRVLLVTGTKGGDFTYDFIQLSAKSGVVSKEHLAAQAKKEEELNAFVEGLQGVEEATLSFQKNVDVVMDKTNPSELTRQKVQEAIYD